MNGYLLKGIAAGTGLHFSLVETGRAVTRGVRFIKDKDEFDEKEREVEKKVKRAPAFDVPPSPTVVVPVSKPQLVEPVIVRPKAIRAVPAPLSLPVDLETVDRKLQVESTPKVLSSAPAVQTPSTPFQAPPPPYPTFQGDVRSLEECMDVFENGPRPISMALSTLNDEEVILLAQNGKIAPYALEKMLGNLERAVTIRRALICKSIFVYAGTR